MVFCDYNTELEVFGLGLAILEFIGVGKILKNFFDWLSQKIESLIDWFSFGTANFAKAFFLFYFILGFTIWIVFRIKQIPLPGKTEYEFYGSLLFSSVVTFFILRLVYFPLLRILLVIANLFLKMFNMKGMLAIIGLLIAITTFVIGTECK